MKNMDNDNNTQEYFKRKIKTIYCIVPVEISYIDTNDSVRNNEIEYASEKELPKLVDRLEFWQGNGLGSIAQIKGCKIQRF